MQEWNIVIRHVDPRRLGLIIDAAQRDGANGESLGPRADMEIVPDIGRTLSGDSVYAPIRHAQPSIVFTGCTFGKMTEDSMRAFLAKIMEADAIDGPVT